MKFKHERQLGNLFLPMVGKKRTAHSNGLDFDLAESDLTHVKWEGRKTQLFTFRGLLHELCGITY